MGRSKGLLFYFFGEKFKFKFIYFLNKKLAAFYPSKFSLLLFCLGKKKEEEGKDKYVWLITIHVEEERREEKKEREGRNGIVRFTERERERERWV